MSDTESIKIAYYCPSCGETWYQLVKPDPNRKLSAEPEALVCGDCLGSLFN